MDKAIFQTLSDDTWNTPFSENVQSRSLHALESGQLIYFPHLAFHILPTEMPLLSAQFADQKCKNISYQPWSDVLRGVKKKSLVEQQLLRELLQRYAQHAKKLIDNLFPLYQDHHQWGRTSYRPVEVANRNTSYRKDDKRLHVDAFPSSPNQGRRILRVFCNINPHGEDRIWRIGEPFEKVTERFLNHISNPMPGMSALLKLLHITKTRRTAYDHYMLHIHDRMKADEHYQRTAHQTEVRFPPGSSWIVQTDQVSHAAMQGRFVLEQTFYLPIEAMQNPKLSPLRVLENKIGKALA